MLFSPRVLRQPLISGCAALPPPRVMRIFPGNDFPFDRTNPGGYIPQGAHPRIIRVPGVIPLGIVLHNVKKTQ